MAIVLVDAYIAVRCRVQADEAFSNTILDLLVTQITQKQLLKSLGDKF